MKLSLPSLNLRYLFIAFLGVALTYNATAQQLKSTQDPKNVKGHQLYKKTKIYDNTVEQSSEKKPRPVGDNAGDRSEYEFNKIKNPFTGKIPDDIFELEAEFSKTLQSTQELKRSANKKGYSYWKNRGPFNVGGRTRALAIDKTNEDIIFAGGVSGGLWRSANGGQSWNKVTKNHQDPSITAIVQDPRPDKSNIWYYGTGERSGNSASGGGAFYTGTGIYKSTDGGRSWRLLENTTDDNIAGASPFEIVNSMAVHPVSGDLYVATINGVHRSKDGGMSFEEVLVGGFDSWTEVMITPSGKIYATLDFFGNPNQGFFTSDDGDKWVDITPTTSKLFNGRTVMTYDPSNDNTVYFFAENLLSKRNPLLFRYKRHYPADQQWADLSANLPTNINGDVGNLNLQGRYNMVVKVKPNDSTFVVIGGTNLYKSTTGFTTPAGQESWIGGYSSRNDISVYKNHHPDQHNLIFYPSNPDKVLSANDGGVQVTEDITSIAGGVEPIEWTSLNNGYLTTQSYAVSFDPEANSDDLISGFQDNGSWYTNSTNSDAEWEEYYGGDGSYNAIADGGMAKYVSSQHANIYRFNFDESGNYVSFARIRPAIAKNPDFITPFILDPNNDNIMYLPDGNRILRNNNLDEVPGGTLSYATVNWVALPQTATPGESYVTALDVSRYPVANRLYYGSNQGGIFRMDNANLDNQQVVDIASGKGMPPGYVSSLSVDPSNSDNVIVAFSNYGISSLFLTENAGETWADISGNLEENADGSGNGPSVRWAAFFGDGQSYFAATSTGLYTAFRLNGKQTRWYREPFRVGNAVVAQVKTRNDGFVALATHGNGLYSAKLPILPWNKIPNPKLSVAYLLDDFIVDQNSADTSVDITDLFVSSSGASIDIALSNSNPDLVSVTIDGDKLLLSYTPEATGKATIGLIATSGGETVSEGFTVTVKEPAIYEQVEAAIGSQSSQFFIDFNGLVQSSDDFTVPEGSSWTINRVLAFGGVNESPLLESATVIIYADLDGKPGEVVYDSGAIKPTSAPDEADMNLTLTKEVSLESGSYWLTVYANLAYNGGNQWFWKTQEKVNGHESHIVDKADLFGLGATEWQPTSQVFGNPPADLRFQIFGTIGEVGAGDGSPQITLATIDAKMATLAWPNPSTDRFNFDLDAIGLSKSSIRIYNLKGQLVFEKDNVLSGKTFTWNASGVAAGIYLVSIKGDNFTYNGKLIKR